MVYNEHLTMNYIDSVTVAVLESDYRGQLLPGGSIYKEFLLQTKQNSKCVKYPLRIFDNFSVQC